MMAAPGLVAPQNADEIKDIAQVLAAGIKTCLSSNLMPWCLANGNGETMNAQLKPSARKVQEALQALNLSCEVVQMTDTTRSASDAARAVGCQVGQIVKSLIFEGQQSHQPIMVAASGANRVNERSVEQSVSEPIKMAKPDYVRQMTGFAIGGVPPIGHDRPLKIFIDEDLLQYHEIWAAAGTPHAVFKLTPDDLKTITGGTVISVK
jgi:prolyl-tRNA editing enzyme YbaK/EbsC (Cys-tRNA(Pro) deacylase)